MPRRMVMDRWLFFTAALLLLGGVFMVGSASHYVAMSKGLDTWHYLVRHIVHVVVGLLGLGLAMSVPYSRLADERVVRATKWLSLAALVGVLMMPPIGGARRWYPLGLFNLQPSEFVKLAVIVFLAALLSRNDKRVNDPWSVPLPVIGTVGTLAFLIVIEPDLGSAVMLCATAFVMVFVAGLRWRYISAAGLLGAVAVAVAVLIAPWRMQRIVALLDPSADPQGAGFQLNQSLIALGSGGLTGLGLGQGQQKALYIPAPHNDFIFAVIGEEWGLVGTLLVLAAFLLLFWRGLRAAVRAPDRFGFYLALGVTTLLVLQALMHMAVCAGLLPTKGLTLPMISYGGSSVVATMIGVGLLLNVSQHSN